MNQSKLIITDSGGVQEEASYLGKPLLIFRESCDRPETVVAGNAILVAPIEQEIIAITELLMNDDNKYSIMSKPNQLYGDGQAAKRIIRGLLDNLHEYDLQR